MTTIENRRFAVMVAIGIILFLLYQAWQKDFAPKSTPPPMADAPTAPADDVPAAPSDTPVAPSAATASGTEAAPAAPATGQRITVSTDKLVAVILANLASRMA